jgi:hypothetical protein
MSDDRYRGDPVLVDLARGRASPDMVVKINPIDEGLFIEEGSHKSIW